MKNLTLSALSVLLLLISSQGIAQENRTFWQKLFGEKFEQVDAEEPKNSQDSLALLLNNHLGEGSNTETTPSRNNNIQSADSAVNLGGKGIGSITIVADKNIIDWLDSAKVADLIGFRIQVFMGDLTEARSIKSLLLNSGERATLEYNSSDYYVRIGDFRNYITAEKKLSDLQELYPSAYVVKDKIKLD
ncbi:MAG: hypothetical protein ACI888_000040 [Flavobacteriales bacterium]|jgi:hypothetical protein